MKKLKIKEQDAVNKTCNIPHVSNPVNCAICGDELTNSEKKGGGNCCDICWLSN